MRRDVVRELPSLADRARQQSKELALQTLAEALEMCSRASLLLDAGQVDASLTLYTRSFRQCIAAQNACGEVALDAAKIRIGCEQTVAKIQTAHPAEFQAWHATNRRIADEWLMARRQECEAFIAACDSRPFSKLPAGLVHDADLVDQLERLQTRCMQADDFIAFADAESFKALSERVAAAGHSLQRRGRRYEQHVRRRAWLLAVAVVVVCAAVSVVALRLLPRESETPQTTGRTIAAKACPLRSAPGEDAALVGNLEAGEKVALAADGARDGWQRIVADDGHAYWVRAGCLAAPLGP